MAPHIAGTELSAKRRQFAGEPGFKGLVSNGKTFAIALFASLGGLVYGCMSWNLICLCEIMKLSVG